MSTGTQISSYTIPAEIWREGLSRRVDLPPLALPARDALEIERRSQGEVALRNETHRYTLCGERIMSIVHELAREKDVLPPPFIWASKAKASGNSINAISFLSLIDILVQINPKNSPYRRIGSIFFPPDHAGIHFQVFGLLRKNPQIDRALSEASRISAYNGKEFEVTIEECKVALEKRYSLLEQINIQKAGLVDVVELV